MKELKVLRLSGSLIALSEFDFICMVGMLGRIHVLSKYREAAKAEEGGELSVGCEDIENFESMEFISRGPSDKWGGGCWCNAVLPWLKGGTVKLPGQ
jgi:hypothetical protein